MAISDRTSNRAEIGSFRCNTCEVNARSHIRSEITIFYVQTQLATEHFPWYSHMFLSDGLKIVCGQFDVQSSCDSV